MQLKGQYKGCHGALRNQKKAENISYLCRLILYLESIPLVLQLTEEKTPTSVLFIIIIIILHFRSS